MTELTYLFGAVAVLAGGLASISIWAPRRLVVKLLAIAGVTLFLPVAYAGFAQLLALPKPVALEWWQANAEEATVLAASLREDEAIYVWLQLQGVDEPRAYALPWQRDLAEQLQAAQRQAEESQTQVQMRLPFEDSLDDREPKFYAMPQPQLPGKDLDRVPPQTYRRHAQRDT
ncbi:MAG: hypothetical protein ACREJ5_18065 [Geminicoccaceae bacterium]